MGLLTAGNAAAAELSGVLQHREVRSTTTDATTGYQCFDPIVGPPLLGCPVDLGTVVDSDVQTAPGFGPFSETATTAGGSASQQSELGARFVHVEGDTVSQASASSFSQAPYLLVTHFVDPVARDDFQVSVHLDAASPYRLELAGSIEYPDPGFPVPWDASLSIQVDGPEGEVASLSALPDYACVSDPESLTCTVAPAPIVRTGVLAAGDHTIDISLETSARGTWLPSVGALAGATRGDFRVTLELLEPAAAPALAPGGRALLALCLLAAAGLARALRFPLVPLRGRGPAGIPARTPARTNRRKLPCAPNVRSEPS